MGTASSPKGSGSLLVGDFIAQKLGDATKAFVELGVAGDGERDADVRRLRLKRKG